ncbi:MerR family transcriptional regulator [Streptomyces sp. NPDC006984]|uniref:MerR family transcriptional regulator n=1 Tax=Streptomyces sp. NPDC006984 TaxID=3155463 RepID=UPI0033C18C04
MRIGELAALAGVTPRTVRHYHQLGLLPEPVRRANGYRDYGLRHAVALARIRRLTELGLGLAEVRDVLADDAGRELAEVLEELDADLVRQLAELGERRARLAELREQARLGRLPAEGPVSDELATLLGSITPSDSPMAAKDREHLVLLDSLVPPEQRAALFEGLRPFAEDPAFAGRVQGLYERLDALADADPDDRRVEPLARELAGSVPDGLLTLAGDGGSRADSAFGQAFLDDFAPAQAAVVRRMLELVADRARAAGRHEGGEGRP